MTMEEKNAKSVSVPSGLERKCRCCHVLLTRFVYLFHPLVCFVMGAHARMCGHVHVCMCVFSIHIISVLSGMALDWQRTESC